MITALTLLVSAGLTGAVVAVEPTVFVALLLAMALGAWIALCRRRPAVAFAIVIGVVFFSSHLFAVAYSLGIPTGVVKYGILAKDVLAWALFVVLGTRTVAEKRSPWALILVATFTALSVGFLFLLPSPAPIAVQLQSVRNALVPALSLGCVAMLKPQERRSASVTCAYMAAAAAAYAIVELALPRQFLSEVVGVGRFWSDVKQQPQFVDPLTDLPFNFATTSGHSRLTGTFGDPLSAGENLGAALILAVASSDALRWRRLVLLLISAGLLLSFTRDGWMLAFVGLSFFGIRRYGAGRALAAAGGTAVALLGAAFFIPALQAYIVNILTGNDASTLAHQAALQDTFDLTFPLLGTGWGTAGAGAFHVYRAAVSTENTYVVVLAQVGWVGSALLVIPLVMLGRLTVRSQPYVAAGIAVFVAQALTGMVSENLLTFNGGFLPFATAGLVASLVPRMLRSPGRNVPVESAPDVGAAARLAGAGEIADAAGLSRGRHSTAGTNVRSPESMSTTREQGRAVVVGRVSGVGRSGGN